MRTVDFIDAVKRRHALHSDYAVSKFFGWRISRVYEYRGGKRELDDEACVQVAAALDLPPVYVMACIHEKRAKSTDVKRYWREAAQILRTRTAAMIAAAAVTIGAQLPTPAHAAPPPLTEQSIHYASKRRRGAFCTA